MYKFRLDDIGKEVIKVIKDNCDDPEDIFDSDELKDWVKNNYEPDNVFPESELKDWAILNGYVHESKIVEEVAKEYSPGEVFPDSELSDWAEDNGYIYDENPDERYD